MAAALCGSLHTLCPSASWGRFAQGVPGTAGSVWILTPPEPLSCSKLSPHSVCQTLIHKVCELEHGADLACGPFENTCLKKEEKKKKLCTCFLWCSKQQKQQPPLSFHRRHKVGLFHELNTSRGSSRLTQDVI